MKLHFASFKAAPFTLLCFFLLLLTVGAWFQSSRYSERHLVYVGAGTIEIFSASSLVRISLVPGRVGDFGGKTFYRQRNARGRMLMRPVYPGFARRSGMLEATIGYWHLAFAGLVLLVWAACWETGKRKALCLREKKAEGRN